ncbi:unnamed protein product [Eretmochelys imbricata]
MMSCGLLTSSKEPGWDGENITQEVPRVLQGELPYTLSRSAMLQSPHGIDHVLSNCPLTPLSYTAGNLTTAQACRWPRPPPWDRELELLVYYTEPPKPSAVLEAGLPGAEPGSLMGDPAVMMTLLPRVPEVVPAQSQPGSSSSCWAAPAARPAPWTQRPETLVLLLKSLPRAVISTSVALGLNSSPSTPVRVYGRGGREHPGDNRRGPTGNWGCLTPPQPCPH